MRGMECELFSDDALKCQRRTGNHCLDSGLELPPTSDIEKCRLDLLYKATNITIVYVLKPTPTHPHTRTRGMTLLQHTRQHTHAHAHTHTHTHTYTHAPAHTHVYLMKSLDHAGERDKTDIHSHGHDDGGMGWGRVTDRDHCHPLC